MNPQEISTAYGRSLVREHLKQFDLVLSAGPYCRTAFHVRRLFEQEQAFPFDWWVTPATSALAMLHPDYRFNLCADAIFLTEAGQVALNSRDQILQLHDFQRDRDGALSMDDLDQQLIQINSKYSFLFERLRQLLHAADHCLLIFEGLMPAQQLETHRLRTACPELNYPALKPSFASEVVAMLRHAYRVEATLVSVGLGPPSINQQGDLLEITAPMLPSAFDEHAEPWQRPWASYDMLIAHLCSALVEPALQSALHKNNPGARI